MDFKNFIFIILNCIFVKLRVEGYFKKLNFCLKSSLLNNKLIKKKKLNNNNKKN